MSNQNDGFQEQKGYVPPAGTQADDQRRAREWDQRQRAIESQRAHEEAVLRQQQDEDRRNERLRKEREAERKNQQRNNQKPERVGEKRVSKPLPKISKKFSYLGAIAAAIAAAVYLAGFTEVETPYSWIIAVITGVFVGYKYKWIIGILVVGALLYFFVLSPSQKQKFKNIVLDEPSVETLGVDHSQEVFCVKNVYL